MSKDNLLQCSFCGKTQDQVQKLIAGPGIYVCDECVELCNDILREEGIITSEPASSKAQFEEQLEAALDASELPVPKEIKEHLDQYVIGNDEAKKTLAVAVYNHYKRIRNNQVKPEVLINKSNILLLGPTGSGKTHVVETLAKYLKVPFAVADATTITEAGYVGDDAENILFRLYQNANFNAEEAERGIIYIDEVDKITRKSENPSITRDVSGEGVQQALLKLIEGTKAQIPAQGNRKHPHAEMVDIDTANILFICGGAFVGLENVIEKRRNKSNSSVGFGSQALTEDEKAKLLSESFKYAQPEDLVHYGMIPEFVGRIPVTTHLDAPDKETLKKILTEPKHALVKQYQKLMELDGVELSFTDEAIEVIAEQAQERKMGARALRSIVEAVMKDIMYEVPSREDIKEFTITADMLKAVKSDKVVDFTTKLATAAKSENSVKRAL